MLYMANPSTAPIRSTMKAGRLGMIATPAQRNSGMPGVKWCADNGCYGKGFPGDVEFLAWLASRREFLPDCIFATAPDVIGDAAATLKRSAPFLPVMRALGYPVAFVAQDGLEKLRVPWDQFDALFIGGSTTFKLGSFVREIAAEGVSRGKWLHMGRVNSERRFNYARDIQCDSVDGTFLAFGPNVNLHKLLGWVMRAAEADLRECDDQ